MRLVGSTRKLRALAGDDATITDDNEMAVYEIKIDLKDGFDLAPEDDVPIGNSGNAQARELAILGMMILASHFLLW